MFRASSANHQEYLKLVQRPLVHVLPLQVSHHISLLGPIPVHVSSTMCSSSRGRNCQMKHQLDATLYRFYFCRVTLHVSGVKRRSSGVFKTSTAATGTCVIVVGQSSHLLIRAGTECFCRVTLWCDDLPTTITHVPVAAVLVLNTPDDGRLTPETCRVTLQK